MESHNVSPNGAPRVHKATKAEELWEIIKFALIALIIVVPIRTYIAKPFIVEGASMVPTFEDKNYLIVDEISYRLSDPKRGDVIVFHPPQNDAVYYIKRVIGLPGETIAIEKGKVTIKNTEHPDGFPLDEDYVSELGTTTLTRTLGETDYFVMGDNRPYSSDSRYFGVLPRDHIRGRAFLRLYPLKDISLFPGEHHSY